MAKNEIERDGKPVRPSFNYPAGYDCMPQLTESIRNVLEGIADSQILSCETRADIRRTRMAVELLVRLAQAKRRKAPMEGKGHDRT
jgi:hypothetical protein